MHIEDQMNGEGLVSRVRRHRPGILGGKDDEIEKENGGDPAKDAVPPSTPQKNPEHHHHHHHHKAETSQNNLPSRTHNRSGSISTVKSTILGRLRSIRSKDGSQHRHRSRSGSTSSSQSTSSDSSVSSDNPPAYYDPSTNVDIMANERGGDGSDQEGRDGNEEQLKKKKKEKDLSQHTFFIENSQMKLKLVARSEVNSSKGY